MVEYVHAGRKNWPKFKHFSKRGLSKRFDEINTLLVPGMSLEQARKSVSEMNKESRIGLEPIDTEAFSLQIRELASVLRFLDDPHVAPKNVDNVARHVFRVVANGDDIFKNEPHDSTNIELRQVFHIATFLHDFGETVREFGSFAKQAEQERALEVNGQLTAAQKEQVKEHAKREIYRIERKICAFGLTLAYTAAYLRQPELHHAAIADLRVAAGVNADGTQNKASTVTAKDAMSVIEKHIDGFKMPATDPAGAEMIRHRVEGLMRYYDMAEAYLGVVGPSVKTMQKADGSDYIFNVMGKDGAVPYDETWNWRIIGAHTRNEGELGDVGRHGDLSHLERLTELVQKHMLARSIDLIKKNPDIVSRAKDAPEAKMAGTDDMRKAKAVMLQQERAARSAQSSLVRWQEAARKDASDQQEVRGMTDPLTGDTLTARRALVVYLAAWLAVGSTERLEREDKYMPTNAPLLTQRRLPEKLKEHVRLLDHLQRIVTSSPGADALAVLEKNHVNPGNAEQARAMRELRAESGFVLDTLKDFGAKRLEIQARRKANAPAAIVEPAAASPVRAEMQKKAALAHKL